MTDIDILIMESRTVLNQVHEQVFDENLFINLN